MARVGSIYQLSGHLSSWCLSFFFLCWWHSGPDEPHFQQCFDTKMETIKMGLLNSSRHEISHGSDLCMFNKLLFCVAEKWQWGCVVAPGAYTTNNGSRKDARSGIVSHIRENGKNDSPFCHASRRFPPTINPSRILWLFRKKCSCAWAPGKPLAFP